MDYEPHRPFLHRVLKKTAEMTCTAAVTPLIGLCKIHRKVNPDFLFSHYGFTLGLIPFDVGRMIRRSFYKGTLKRCGHSLSVGTGSYFVDPDTEVGDRFLCASYCVISRAHIEDYVMLASHVSITSGLGQHGFEDQDIENPKIFQEGERQKVTIGRNAWIGEGARVGADVGKNSVVGIGAVVTREVKPNVVVLGNPARVVRHLKHPGETASQGAAAATRATDPASTTAGGASLGGRGPVPGATQPAVTPNTKGRTSV